MVQLAHFDVSVPQGSVLGPTLFLIFVNDIRHLPLRGSLYLYADDTALFYSGIDDAINCHNMNHDLALLSWYFRTNLLTLNKDKTKYMHFHSSVVRLSDRIPVVIEDEVIEKVNSFVYLGLKLDTHLNFGPHIEMICGRVSPALAALYKLRNVLPTEALRLIYFSLFHSHVDYLCSIWGQTHSCYLRPIQVLQNRALKIVHGLPSMTSTVSLYSDYVRNVLPIRGICELQIVRLVRQIMNGEVFHHTSFSVRDSIQSLRDALRVGSPSVRTVLGARQISYAGPGHFNQLPIEMRRITNTSKFIRNVKAYLSLPTSLERLLNN